jgi:aryl sulfotransferase
MAGEPARRVYRSWIIDSRRWDRYRPRPGDIVIATAPKCGTTWMQRIVSLLIFQTPVPLPIMEISPWIDRRFPAPIEAVMAQAEAQRHRRFLKSHLPSDGLPLFDEVRYIHVARDARDACLSYHNHSLALTPEVIRAMDRVGSEDETLARPYPRPHPDPRIFYRRWMAMGLGDADDGWPILSLFDLVQSWWNERHRPNVLLVHYSDLKRDLAGELRRIARFLDIEVAAERWPALVDAARFETMRRDGSVLLGAVAGMFTGGANRFLQRGENNRWRGVLTEDDLALYRAKLARLTPDCASWLQHGSLPAEQEAERRRYAAG